jgi:hypothetical protein
MKSFYFNNKHGFDLAKGTYKFDVYDRIEEYLKNVNYKLCRHERTAPEVIYIEIFLTLVAEHKGMDFVKELFEFLTEDNNGYNLHWAHKLDVWCADRKDSRYRITKDGVRCFLCSPNFTMLKKMNAPQWAMIKDFYMNESLIRGLAQELKHFKTRASKRIDTQLNYFEVEKEEHPNCKYRLRERTHAAEKVM